ncbi:hypothetical protein KPL70_020645 [Citrus sinensis]|nr:hypothetical protein KPL70_020645 [Citrus sinensis]
MGLKVDLEKFIGQNDFNMWKIKMEALLITQGLGDAIDPVSKLEGSEASSSKTPEQVAEIDTKARSTIILSLGDSVIREVAKEKTVVGLWAKLGNVYMTKSLANRLYIKKKMFSLRMIKGTSLNKHIDEFNKVCDELETIDEGLSDEIKALLLISSLPKSYEHFVDALLYGRQTLSLEEVKYALGTKKLKDKQDNPESESSEGLMARGKSEKRESKGKKQGKLKSKQKNLKCFHCHKEWHFKRDCPERKNKNKENKEMTGNAAIATDEEGSFETAGVLIATNQKPQGKSSRLRFETAAHTTKEKLGYIHSDLWGPAQVNSLGETLRIDNGLEYCNKLFEEFCEKNGIQKHKIITYTPQQNGLAERINRTLVEKGKLEPRALKCRFLRYPEGVKGYRLWCVDSKPPQCIISRDVTFHEDEILNRPKSHVNNSESGDETDKVKFQMEPHNLKELEPEIEGAEIEPKAGVEHESAESEEDTYQLARDRKRRTIRPPRRNVMADLIEYALTAAQELNDDKPKTYQEAITGKNKLEWKRAMNEEMASLMKNKT